MTQIKSEIKSEILNIDGKEVLMLQPYISKRILPDPALADIWVINHRKEYKVRSFLIKVIRSKDPKMFLKPIFIESGLKKEYGNNAEYIAKMCDGFIKDMNFVKKYTLLDRVDYFISKYYDSRLNMESFSQDEINKQKIFDYFYTRKRKIKSIRTTISLSGYAFPLINNFFYDIKDGAVYSRFLLRQMFEDGLLSRKYVDTLHLCNSCNGGFLNYREICPKCSSHNLRVQSLVHHFRCAYVAPELDFTVNDKLLCPKCSGQLQNLAVDYDKPGVVYCCKNHHCKHEFQQAPIQVGCVHCKAEQFPEELVVRKVYKYDFTEKGINHFLKRNS